MVQAIAGSGFARLINIGFNVDDAGVSKKLAELNARVGATAGAFGEAGESAEDFRSEMALLTFALGGFTLQVTQAFKDFERATLLAAFAVEGSAEDARQSVSELRKETRRFSSQLNILTDEVGELERTVGQLGVSNEVARKSLIEASGAMEKLGEVGANLAAESLFRLAFATQQSQRGAERLLQNAEGLGSAFVKVAESSPGGVQATQKFIERIQTSNTVLKLNSAQLISLASAFTTLATRTRGASAAATSFLRVFTRKLPQNFEAFRQLVLDFSTNLGPRLRQELEGSADSFDRFAQEERFQLILAFASALGNLSRQAQEGKISTKEFGEITSELGVTMRDLRTFSQLYASDVERIAGFQRMATREMRKGSGEIGQQTELMQRFSQVTRTFDERVKSLRVEFNRFFVEIGRFTATIFEPFVIALEGLVAAARESRAITNLFGALATVGTVASLLSTLRLFNLTRKAAGIVGANAELVLPTQAAKKIGATATKGTRALFTQMGRNMVRRPPLVSSAGIQAAGTRQFLSREAVPRAPVLTPLGRRLEGRLAGAITRVRSSTIARAFGAMMSMTIPEAAPFIGGRALGAVLGTVFNVGIILDVLGPVFSKLSDFLNQVSRQGGAVGVLADGIAFLLEALRLAGNIVGAVVDGIFRAVRELFEILSKIPLVGEAINQMGNFMDFLRRETKQANVALEERRELIRGSPPTGGEGESQVQQNFNTTVQAGDSRQTEKAAERTMKESAQRARLDV